MATTVTSASTAPPLQGTITSNGTGSGLDVQGIVQKLVAAEGAPQSSRLDAAEADVQAKLSALGSLRSALSSFQDSLAKVKDLTTFQGRKVVLSSEEFLSATASSTAVPASYSVEVEQLAQAQKLQSDVLRVELRRRRHGHADDHLRRQELRRRHRLDQQHGGQDRGRDQFVRRERQSSSRP